MIHVDLFTGMGGGILAGQLLGWRTIAACEIDPWCRELLIRRQNDATISPFPIWDDVRTFPGKSFRDRVDVVSGGFPCQDISLAGHKRERAQQELFDRGKHIEADRSGLWSEMRRLIEEIRPRFVFVENVPALRSRGLGRVLRDLSSLGFDAEWDCIRASDLGAPHKRDRLWILAAHPDREPIRELSERNEGGRERVQRKRDALSGHAGKTSPHPDRGRCEGERLTEHGEEQGPRGNLPDGLGEGRRREGEDAPDAMLDRPQGRREEGPANPLGLRRGGPWAETEPPIFSVDDGP
ncbi:unnamed protein product, partial [marine sediment metagenome]